MNKALASYQKAQFDGLNQRDLIVMCFKGAIKYLSKAQEELLQQNYEEFLDLIEKAHRVVFHLYTTLDLDRGGEIAVKLADLYSFIINKLYMLNATKKAEIFDEVIPILKTLQEGWENLDMQVAAEQQKAMQRQDYPQDNNSEKKIVSVEV